MRKIGILALLAVCCSVISFAEANDSITCVNDNDSAEFSIVVATITEVTIHAENKFKPGLLNFEYIAKMGDEEVRICPLKDIDMDDSKYPDVKLGETYVLVVKETATKKEILQTPTPYNRINPVSDLEKRTWEMKSYDAYNLNFGKVLPFQYILNLDIPDNVPADVKKIGEKFYKKVVKLFPEGKNRISLTKKMSVPQILEERSTFKLTPKPTYQICI